MNYTPSARKINVLVTAAGSAIGYPLVQYLSRNKNYRIIGCDISKWAVGFHWCNKRYIVPRVDSAGYLIKMCKIIEKENIDIIIPCCDPELEVMEFLKPYCEVLIAPHDAVMTCRDKMETVCFLERHEFPYPKTVNLLSADQLDFPFIIKPKYGSGTRNVRVVFSQRELDLYRFNSDAFLYIAQEYLIPENWKKPITQKDVYQNGLLNQTDEFSTEVLVAKNHEILGAITNWRTMKKGDSIRAIIDEFPEVTENAVKIVEKLIEEFGYVGPCNIQSRKIEKGVVTFEINPRFTGSTIVRCQAGFNGPDVLIQNFLNGIKIYPKWQKLVTMRYWDGLYFPKAEFDEMEFDTV